jgi:hypothetical protein
MQGRDDVERARRLMDACKDNLEAGLLILASKVCSICGLMQPDVELQVPEGVYLCPACQKALHSADFDRKVEALV